MADRPRKVLRALIETTQPLWGLYYKRTLEKLVDPFPRLLEWIDNLEGFPLKQAVCEITRAAKLNRCKAKTLSELLPHLEDRTIADKNLLILPAVIRGMEKISQIANLLNRFLHFLENPPGNTITIPRLELYVQCTRFNWPVLIQTLAKELGMSIRQVTNDLTEELSPEEKKLAFQDTALELKVVRGMIIRYGINFAHLLQAHGINEGKREATPSNTLN